MKTIDINHYVRSPYHPKQEGGGGINDKNQIIILRNNEKDGYSMN